MYRPVVVPRWVRWVFAMGADAIGGPVTHPVQGREPAIPARLCASSGRGDRVGQFAKAIRGAAVLAVAVAPLAPLRAPAGGPATGWRLAPLSLHAPGPTSSTLSGVSCAGAVCVAVGSVSAGSGADAWGGLEVAVERGGRWTVQVLDQGAAQGSVPELTSVSCTSATHCVAVGADATHLVAATLTGTTWTVADLPGTLADDWLTSVSCWVGGCTAVGVADSTTTTDLVETLDGGTWSATTSAIPVAAPGGLSAVDCPSPATCTAVGQGVVAEESGGGWTATAVPAAGSPVTWGGLSCWAVASCLAVGSDATSTGRLLTIDGASVTTGTLPLPGGASGLSSVWCASQSSCEASVVGRAFEAGAVERLAGGTWTTSLLPYETAPFDDLSGLSCTAVSSCVVTVTVGVVVEERASTWHRVGLEAAPGPVDASLTSVSCPTPTRCVAVGTYENVSDEDRPFVATLADGTWRGAVLPVPAGTTQLDLSSISCVETACVAVGSEVSTTSTRERAVVARSTGGAWALSVLPLAAATSAAALDGVACRSATWCVAVGSATTCHVACTRPLVETLGGAGWQPAVLGLPAHSDAAWLSTVSCWSVRACVAAGGGALASNGNAHGITESLDGARWVSRTYAIPSPGDGEDLSSVSCVIGGVCRALGSFNVFESRPPGYDVPILVEGHASEPMALAQPWGDNGWPLNGISCTTPEDCTVVGYSLSGPAIVSVRSSSRWRTSELPLPAGAVNVLLDAVDCTSPSACVGVGSTTLAASTAPIVATRT